MYLHAFLDYPFGVAMVVVVFLVRAQPLRSTHFTWRMPPIVTPCAATHKHGKHLFVSVLLAVAVVLLVLVSLLLMLSLLLSLSLSLCYHCCTMSMMLMLMLMLRETPLVDLLLFQIILSIYYSLFVHHSNYILSL